MIRKNIPHNLLLNGDLLSFSVNVIKDLLGLKSGSNVVYSDRDIVFHLLNACISQTIVNHLSDLCADAPSEGTIRYRICNLDLDETQEKVNEKLKIHGFKTLSRKFNTFAIDFINIPCYGKEKNDEKTIETKPEIRN